MPEGSTRFTFVALSKLTVSRLQYGMSALAAQDESDVKPPRTYAIAGSDPPKRRS